jgi:hypothetical protein
LDVFELDSGVGLGILKYRVRTGVKPLPEQDREIHS